MCNSKKDYKGAIRKSLEEVNKTRNVGKRSDFARNHNSILHRNLKAKNEWTCLSNLVFSVSFNVLCFSIWSESSPMLCTRCLTLINNKITIPNKNCKNLKETLNYMSTMRERWSEKEREKNRKREREKERKRREREI